MRVIMNFNVMVANVFIAIWNTVIFISAVASTIALIVAVFGSVIGILIVFAVGTWVLIVPYVFIMCFQAEFVSWCEGECLPIITANNIKLWAINTVQIAGISFAVFWFMAKFTY